MKRIGQHFYKLVFLLLALLGITTTYYSVLSTRDAFHSSLIGRVASVSAFVESSEIAKLAGAPNDVGKPEYIDIKNRMIDAAKQNPDVRYVYLMGQDSTGVFFYGDSVSPTDTNNYSAPGDRYMEASDALKGIFTSAGNVVEGPSKDSFGTWMSGLSPVHDSSGKVVAVLGMDIPYASYRNEQIKNATIPIGAIATLSLVLWFSMRMRRREKQSFDLKAELVSVASHDLRSPLTGIEWAVKSIADEPKVDQGSRKLARAVGATVAELRNTVNTILQLAIEEKGIDTGLNLESVSLLSLVDDVKTIFTLTAESRDVTIVVDPSLSDKVMVTVDRDKYKRALSNLINNAVKYTNKGTKITVGYVYKDHMHTISVKDEGIGIPKADQEKVLEGFHRAANAARSGIEGTGLGMILTKRIIEAHGGTLDFTSVENAGTTFYLHLPETVEKTS